MKKILAFGLVLCLVLPAAALAGKVGFGVSGGSLFPIVQDDQESGYTLGLKVRAEINPFLAFEPNLNIASFGETTITGVGSRDGSDITHYGIDLTLGGGMGGPGLKPYAFIGGALYNTKRDGDDTTNKSGWSFGAGLALGIMERVDIDLRSRFNIISSEGSTSRKSVSVTVGAVYFFGQK